ncbi:hypothetical protein [Paenibacillus glucanolyticus]|uniref:hypothetical protein n=1 Tax=Paenibacillus glucanolyticus TaxID=59843 RepID=UPI0034CD103F
MKKPRKIRRDRENREDIGLTGKGYEAGRSERGLRRRDRESRRIRERIEKRR